jgi:hypothetical protein
VFFSIGDPGRAALELPAGAPGDRIGAADVELSTASLPGMLIQAATARGLQHRAAGTPRQDAFALARRCEADEVRRAVIVVCDGVGAFGRSDEAAMLVSRRLAALGAEGMAWPDAFVSANEELLKAAQDARDAQADGTADGTGHGMATTAIAAVVHREAGEWVGEAAWVGDSTLWHLDRDARWSLVTDPLDDGVETDYHSGGVTPLPSADGACSSCEFRFRGGALFAMSDGVANPLQWSQEVQEALASWWTRPPDPFTFAAQVVFARKSHLDDRTVVGIWPNKDGPDADDQQT